MTTAAENKAKMSPEEEAELFAALLTTDMDDIEKQAGLVNLPDGSYVLAVTKASVNRAKLAIVLMLEVEQIVELANPGEDEGKASVGDKYCERYTKAFGITRLRTVFEEVMLQLNARDPVSLVEALNGTRLLVSIGHRTDKNDPTKHYSEIRAVTLAP